MGIFVCEIFYYTVLLTKEDQSPRHWHTRGRGKPLQFCCNVRAGMFGPECSLEATLLLVLHTTHFTKCLLLLAYTALWFTARLPPRCSRYASRL